MKNGIFCVSAEESFWGLIYTGRQLSDGVKIKTAEKDKCGIIMLFKKL
ncbi:MAG: hypothetical protein ACI4QV_01900 [Acutalibacteraceae bacterium]